MPQYQSQHIKRLVLGSVSKGWLYTLFVCLICIGNVSFALTLKPTSLSKLVSESPLIIRGRVITQNMRRGIPPKESGRWIFTLSKVQVLNCIKVKDTCPSEVMVSQIGGSLDGITLTIPGSKLLATDQEVILFLTPKPESGHFVITGFTQGMRVIGQEISIKDANELIYEISQVLLNTPQTQ